MTSTPLNQAIKLQQNLNKLRFYATSTEQQKELVKMKNLVARNVYKSYTEDILDTPTVRATNRMVKSALEQTQEQLKETGEGTPYNNLKELVDKQTKGENNEIR